MNALPHDLDFERGLLGCLLLDPGLYDVASDQISEDDFYSPRNGLIWTAIRSLAKRSEAIDLTTVKSHLKANGKLDAAGGDDYLFSLIDTIPTISNAETYARKVAELSQLRRMIGTCQDLATEGYKSADEVPEYLDRTESAILSAANRREDPTTCQSIGDVAATVFRDVDAATHRGEEIRGLSSGLIDLDQMLGGFRPGQLIIVAGRPSMGKSAFVGCIALSVAQSRQSVFVASLEMSKEMWAQRLIAALSHIDGSQIRNAKLRREDWEPFGNACDELSTLPIDIDDSASLTLLSLRAKCRRARKRRGGLGLIAIDYLQLLRAGGRYDSREREIAEISRSLKALAKELNVPVVALSQLNRAVEARTDKRPTLGDLRESGAIEQDADAVLMIYRPEVYNATAENYGLAEIIVAKQRCGPVGTVRCRFDKALTRFDNLQRGECDEPKHPPSHLRAVPEPEPYWRDHGN